MRTVEGYLRQGAATAMLAELIMQARQLGLTRLALETGSSVAFEPARNLYSHHGFVECGPFADYKLDPHSIFMSLELE